VQNKSKQRWLWYALDKISLKVVAYTFGTRCDSTLESLLKKLENFKVTFYYTDGWGSYARLLAPKKHIISKKYTQRIERTNLNLRTRCKRLARKTICFSKSLDIHDKVIGTLIERIAF
jgi:insertion element IS1 protein InsB